MKVFTFQINIKHKLLTKLYTRIFIIFLFLSVKFNFEHATWCTEDPNRESFENWRNFAIFGGFEDLNYFQNNFII